VKFGQPDAELLINADREQPHSLGRWLQSGG
jgi:hypothetical protein